MRRSLLALVAVLALALGACGPVDQGQSQAGGDGQGDQGGNGGGDSCDPAPVTNPGTLTVGTSFPYYAPFKSGDRNNPKGYEPDIAEEIAQRLGLENVEWSIAPFESLYAPGTKPFDFAMDQISITPARAKVVDFSRPYYLIQQGLLVRAGTPITNAQTIADLRQYKFGAQAGTTGLTYIEEQIQPTEPPNVYNDTVDAAQALSVGQIDAVVIDVPIAIPLTNQYKGTVVAGQFIVDEGYGLAFPEQDSELLPCVNQALAEMEQDGTLDRLRQKWLPRLSIDIPVIK